MAEASLLRVAIVYDCLHPWTVGGEERWLRELAESLAARGHQVTYLTRQQWPDEEPPHIDGVRVLAVAPRDVLYGEDGSRQPAQAVRFGLGVGRHLARHRHDYDVVHTCSFPYFHLPALRAALAGTGVPVLVDWPEVWSSAYWRSYAGVAAGTVGSLVQRLCARLTPYPLSYSRRHGGRLAALGVPRPVALAGGIGPEPQGSADLPAAATVPPSVVFAGRLIREKRPVLVPLAVAAAQAAVPGLQGSVYGDGPERSAVLAAIAALPPGVVVRAPGFVPAAGLAAGLAGATALLHPSSREGFGIVVLEAAARGTPIVVVDGPDNAAVELVTEGVNGAVAADAEPATVAAAIARVHRGGARLRGSTRDWYDTQAPRLAAGATVAALEEVYRGLVAAPRAERDVVWLAWRAAGAARLSSTEG